MVTLISKLRYFCKKILFNNDPNSGRDEANVYANGKLLIKFLPPEFLSGTIGIIVASFNLSSAIRTQKLLF